MLSKARCRKRIEEVFGWIKSSAGLAKVKLRGRDRVDAAFTLALAEGRAEAKALRFASAAAALKCARFGGIAGAPTRAEVEHLLMKS